MSELKKDREVLFDKYKCMVTRKEFNCIYDYCFYKEYKGVLLKTVLDQMNMLCRSISIIKKSIFFWAKCDALNVYYNIYNTPKFIGHNDCYKNKPLYVFFENNITDYESIATPTANKRFMLLKAFFDWLVSSGCLKVNVFKGINCKIDLRKDSRIIHAYNEEHLKIIFSDELYRNKNNCNSYKYWIPIMSACLGIRQGEVAQLHKNDVMIRDNIWYLSINNDNYHKRVKNKNSIREIPITKKLIELGFIAFVNSIEDGQIFKDLKRCKRDGYGRDVSRWYSKEKKKWNFGIGYNFHSFRHYLINTLKQNNVDVCIASEITGHSYESIAYDRYGKEFSLKQKKKILDKNISKYILFLPEIYPYKKDNMFICWLKKILTQLKYIK